jgi:hypothetical protein
MRSRFETMARIGYTARGIVFLIVGIFATLAAFSGQPAVGTKGAVEKLLSATPGAILLGIVAAGLMCFAAWRFAQALLDADHDGRSGKALVLRMVYVANGLFYFGMAIWCVSLILTFRGGTDDDQATRDWTGWLLDQPFGRWLVIAAGAGIAATGIGVAITGLCGHFEQRLELDAATREWLVPLGRYGLFARGIVFVMIAVFLILAAVHFDAREAKGLGGAFRALQEQPYGWILLALGAAGFLAFGAYELIQAAYRRVPAMGLPQASAQSGG